MIEMAQPAHKNLQRVTRGDKLDRIENHFISEATSFFNVFIIVVGFAIILISVGVIFLFARIISVASITAIASAFVGIISKLLYDKHTDANSRVNEMQLRWEEEEREEKRKQEQEQEERRKRQELEQKEEQKISDYMKMLVTYYDLASKTDDEQEKEAYFHIFFKSEQYNKRKVETYIMILQLKDEEAKRAFFREKLGLLHNASEAGTA